MVSLFGHASISATRGTAGVTLLKAAIALLAYVVVFCNDTLRRDRIAYASSDPELRCLQRCQILQARR